MTCPYCAGRGCVEVASVVTYAGERRVDDLVVIECPWCEEPWDVDTDEGDDDE